MKENRNVVPMRMAKTGYIVLALFFCALGVVMMALPDLTLAVLHWVLGVYMILFGAVKLVGYFSKDLYRLAFQYDLAFGALLIALGVITLARPALTMSVLCVMLGVPLLADGLFRVQMAIDAKRFGIPQWWLILILAILLGCFGVLLVLRPSESARALTTLLGLGLLGEGLLNLCVAVSAVKIVDHQRYDEMGV